MPSMTICAVIAVDHGTYYGSSAVPVLSEKIASSFPKIHSSTSPLALISRRTQFPPQLVERINTPSVFCLLPCLTTCILNASLGFRLGVVLSSNSSFASFDFVLHWLEFSHPPPASFTFALLTLTKIPTVTSCLGGFYAQGGKHSPISIRLFTTWAWIQRVVQGVHTERCNSKRIQTKEAQNSSIKSEAPNSFMHPVLQRN